LANNDFYGGLIKDYEVSDSGNNMANMQALYKAMTGQDAGDKTYDELAKAVAEIGVNNQLSDNMTELAETLAGIEDKATRDQIGALLSDSGTGLTKEMVGKLFGDDVSNSINREALEEYFANAGTSLDEMATTMGVSTDALVKQIETNTRKSYKVQVEAMSRLNTVRKKYLENDYAEQEKFSNLSITQTAAIADKLSNILATSGVDLASDFEVVASGLGDKADMFTTYISSINWSDIDIKDKIKTELEGLGIVWSETIEDFVNKAFEVGRAISIINFETLNQDLKKVYDLLNQLRSGGQNREFEEEQYKQLIEADSSLTKEFV
jgi:hypothetical protein